MKKLNICLFSFLLNIHCQAQNKEYSKIDFEMPSKSILKNGILFSGIPIEIQDNFYKELGFMKMYFFPKKEQKQLNILIANENKKNTAQIITDSIYTITQSKKVLEYFEVYVYWVEKKYLESEKETWEDGSIHDLWFPAKTKPIAYNLYKLTSKGWLFLEKKENVTTDKYCHDCLIPYLSENVMPDSWKKK